MTRGSGDWGDLYVDRAAAPHAGLTYDELVLATQPSSLTLHAPLQESSGSAVDLSDTGASGNMENAPTQGDPGPHAGLKAVTFDGVDQRIDFGDDAGWSIATTGLLTVLAWAKPTSGVAHQDAVVAKGGTGGDTYEWRCDRMASGGSSYATVVWTLAGTQIASAIGGGTYNDDTWACVAWKFDEGNDNIKIRINGTEEDEATGTWSAAAQDGTGELWIGGRSDGAHFWVGSICRVSIWDALLTDAEIDAIYQKGLVA